MTKTYTITLTDAEDKALSVVAMSQQDWIDNAVKTRCAVSMEEIVRNEVDRCIAAGEPIPSNRDDIVLQAQVETAAQRNARIQAEVLAQRNAQ